MGIQITEEICRKAERFAANGLTMRQIAYSLGMGHSSFYEKQKEFPEFKEAIEVGRAKGIAVISNALFETAKTGNVAAQIFYLKNRSPDSWKDARFMPGDDGGAVPPAVRVEIVDGRAKPD